MADQNYLITARKYRPLLFSELVAQEHVTETLKNAIRLDRLAHAYMFTGPRGVGKTTAARILAKAINCTTPPEDREDRSEPCRACPSCLSFEEGRNLNIIEIDAASNNKVDDARDLRETVRIPPQGAKMKVYIVDEVHMLTTSAFNALLKTLEEPPPHVLFIFATTEPHKVLPTIQSRCQRFDFRRIAVPEIISRLREICKIEKITADESSLMLIARKGDGALRDALSVFDQAVSLCGTSLVYDDIIRALGVVDADLYFEVTDASVGADSARMIQIVEKIVRSGYDLQEFLDGLGEHLRNMLVIKTVGDRSLVEATSSVQDRYEAEAARFSESVLLRLVHIVGETGDLLRNTRQPRLRLEMALLKMTRLPSALDIRTALEKIERLEGMVAKLPGPGEKAPSAPVVREKTDTKSAESGRLPNATHPNTGSSEESSEAPANVDESAREHPGHPPIKEDPSAPRKSSRDVAEPDAPDASTAPDTSTGGDTSLAVESSDPTGTQERAVPRESTTPKLPFDTPALQRRRPKTENRLPSEETQSGPIEMGEVAVLDSEEETPPHVVAAWKQLVQDVMENQIRLGSLLRHTSVLDVRGEHLRIAVPDSFHERMLRSERQQLAQRLIESTGLEIRDIHFEVSQSLADELADSSDDQFDARAALMKKCEENPAVQSLVERFGGEIVW